MTKKIIIILLVTFFIGAKLLVAATITCSNEEYNCQIHINMGHKGEEELAYVQISFGEQKTFTYQAIDLGEHHILWNSSEPPFEGNKLTISSKRRLRSKPRFNLEIDGRKGTLIFRNKNYPLECSWKR